MNKKGVTLIEVIVSIVLISIVILLFSRLLVSLNRESNLSEEKNKFTLNQSIVVRDITKQLIQHSNNITGIEFGDNNNIIKIVRKPDLTEPGKCHNNLSIYIEVYENKIESYRQLDVIDENTNDGNICGGKDGPFVIINPIIDRSIPTGGKYLIDDITINDNCTDDNSEINNCAFLITIPAIDSYGNHYDIELPGTYNKNENG